MAWHSSKSPKEFLERRIKVHKNAFSDSKSRMFGSLESKRGLKVKLESVYLSPAERTLYAGQVRLKSQAAADFRKMANWHKKLEIKLKKKKQRLFLR